MKLRELKEDDLFEMNKATLIDLVCCNIERLQKKGIHFYIDEEKVKEE